MKTMAFAAALGAAILSGGAACAADVKVDLAGVQARGGTLLIALQTREQFMKPAGAYGAHVDAPKAGTAQAVIRGVAPGEYALTVLHDVDGDKNMDVAANGLPTEGWAMSKGETLRGPPSFDQVKFTVTAEGAAVAAPMLYMDGKIPGQN